MSFEIESLNRTSSGMNTDSITEWSYLTSDTGLDIGAASPNYFNRASIKFRTNDIITAVTNKDVSPRTLKYRVTVNGSAGTVDLNLVERPIYVPMYLGPDYFQFGEPIDAILFPLADVFVNEAWNRYHIAGLQYTFRLNGAPTPVTFAINLNGDLKKNFIADGPANVSNTEVFSSPMVMRATDVLQLRMVIRPQILYESMNINFEFQPVAEFSIPP